MTYPPIVNQLAKLAAKHKLVPFIGAGSSVGHLKIDWDEISQLMAEDRQD